jgi:peptidoglycan/xylan/chitin deacetylase (PgdA/CDA1 family)
MPSEFPDFPAPDRGPRHSAGAVRRPFGDAAWAGEAADSTGRHRRPESLADHTRLRPVSAMPSSGGLPPPVGRAAQRRAEARRRFSRPRNRRGKHIKQADPLSLTVRSIPVVIDAAGAVRDWAMDTGTQPPVTGSHRAPGTLPIESWLLVGKHRQQALLAGLVAAGLALVMIPMQQSPGINAVNAADHGFASAQASQKSRTKTPGATKSPGSADKPGGKKTAPAPPAPAPSSAAPTQPGEPAIAVPQGTGPANSLRTTGSDTVALTFDDGPDPVQTPKILALLAQYQIKATFCLIGENVQKHPEIVRQIVAAGHTLCNHTWNHSLTIGKDNPAAIRADLEKTNAAIRAAVPDAQIPFFRAPGGNFTDRLVSIAYGEQMTSLYWQVDPRDWDHTTDDDDTTHTDRVITSVQKSVKPGSIILSHDFNQPDTISAYQKLLPYLTENFQIGLPVPPPTAPASTPADPAPADSAAPPPAPADN